ncbi:MAG: MATE family efflux transporter [Planctomycetota bacterium]|nr:MATE family efflux transporter [Planctomycetota bacterium]
MASSPIRSGKLAGLSMWSAIWVLALPVLIQQVMAALVGLVDTIYAGHLPGAMLVPALDAISIGSYVTWFVMIAMTGLGIGGQALIARAMGAGNRAESHSALGHAVTMSVLWGVIVGVVLWLGAAPLAHICGLTDVAADLLVVYVRILAYAMPAAGLMLVGSMCLHGAGETTLPSVIAVAVNIVNVFVSWALSGVDLTFGDWTLVNPFSFDLYVRGIAMGTSLAYLLGAALTWWVLRRGVKDLRLERRDLALHRSMSMRLVRVGLPGFFDSIMMWTANLAVLIVIGMVAAAEAVDGVPKEGLQGAHLIAIRWESFSFLPGFALGTAAGALAGQYLGAGNPRLAQRAILACTGIGAVLMGGLGLVFMFGGDFLTRIISDHPIHRAETPALLFICGTVQVFFAITMVIRQGLRGVGDTRWTFLITTVASFGIRLPAAWLFAVVLEMGLKGVWIGMCGEIALRALLFGWRFFHGGWKRLEV